MTFDRLDDRAAIADQMYRDARATDWLETAGMSSTRGDANRWSTCSGGRDATC